MGFGALPSVAPLRLSLPLCPLLSLWPLLPTQHTPRLLLPPPYAPHQPTSGQLQFVSKAREEGNA